MRETATESDSPREDAASEESELDAGSTPEDRQKDALAPSDTPVTIETQDAPVVSNEPPAPIDDMMEPAPEQVEPQPPSADEPTVAPAGTTAPDAPSGPVIVSGSATVNCEVVSESTLTFGLDLGPDGEPSITSSRVFYARLSVDGLTRENFLSGLAEVHGLPALDPDPCPQLDQRDIPCTYDQSGTGIPQLATSAVSIASNGELLVHCGTETSTLSGSGTTTSASVAAAEQVTFWYRYLAE